MRSVLSAVALVLVVLSGAAPAQEIERNIVTGGPSGTYIQIGRDIARVAGECGIALNVQESAGSLENFLAVRQRRHTQFGIVQSDVLEYFKTFEADDPAIRRAIFGVRIAFPLYDEEVHVVAREGIGTLDELSGKRVAIGEEDSGTFLTASLLMDLAGVEPAETLTIGPNESLEALLAGEADAMFYVAGAPTRLFEDERIDGRFRLVPITDPTLRAVYTPATVEAGTYPWLDGPVDLVAVKAVLMTFDYEPGTNEYHRRSCEAVSQISHLVLTRFGELQRDGHPKWRDVDLTAIPPGWQIGACVNRGLEPGYELACERVAEPAEAGDDGEAEANAAYRERICAAIGC